MRNLHWAPAILCKPSIAFYSDRCVTEALSNRLVVRLGSCCLLKDTWHCWCYCTDWDRIAWQVKEKNQCNIVQRSVHITVYSLYRWSLRNAHWVRGGHCIRNLTFQGSFSAPLTYQSFSGDRTLNIDDVYEVVKQAFSCEYHLTVECHGSLLSDGWLVPYDTSITSVAYANTTGSFCASENGRICIYPSISSGLLGYGLLDRYVKLQVAHAPGVLGTFSPPPRVGGPSMHRGTCVTHVMWFMPGSLTSGFIWSRWRGKRSRHSRRMRNAQFYVSGKRSIVFGQSDYAKLVKTGRSK